MTSPDSNRTEKNKELKRLRDIVHHAVVGIFQVTASGRYLLVNPKMAQIVGYDSSEEFMDSVDDIYQLYANPEDRTDILKKFDRQGFLDGQDIRFRRKDGSIIWVRVNGRVIWDMESEPVYEGFMVDITETKEAEDKLVSSEKRYRSLVEMSPEAVVVHREGDIILANTAAGTLLCGDGSVSMSGKNLYDFFHPEDRKVTLARRKQLLSNGQTTPYREFRLTRSGGEEFICEVSGSLVSIDGEDAVQSVLRDVTRRKKADKELKRLGEQLLQAQKMEAIGTLAGGIAHDFNNILTVITGYTELALTRAAADQPEPVEMKQVLKAAQRAKELVKHILTFSRKSEVEFKPMNLNQAVGHAAGILKSTLPKTIRIEVELAPDPALIRGDFNHLEQVLMNLAANAADAMAGGGKLFIETANLRLDQAFADTHMDMEPGEYVLLKVTDTGSGMDKSVLQQAFDPFFTTKGLGKGTGLGLSMVFGIVKNHDGHIYTYSEPGVGTVFNIYFPVLEDHSQSVFTPLPLVSEISGGDEIILVVDDEPGIRDIAGQALTEAGYQVLSASSGEEALDKYRSGNRPIDLVMLDVGMPGMGGDRCLKELLRHDPGAAVVISSGYSPDGSLRETLNAGAAGYVAKPYRVYELLSEVRKVLDRKKQSG